MKIDAKVIRIEDGTTLIRPSRNILTGLIGGGLILYNVVLKNPAPGALFTNRSEVVFKDIKIKMKCDCENTHCLECTQNVFKCQQLQNIVCTQDRLEEENGICKDLLTTLISNTNCQVSLKFFFHM
jgi:hypothetical protein